MNGKLTTGAAYGTSVATIIAGMTLNEWAALAGIIGVIGTLACNWFFKTRDARRADEKQREEIAKTRLEIALLDAELKKKRGGL